MEEVQFALTEEQEIRNKSLILSGAEVNKGDVWCLQ